MGDAAGGRALHDPGRLALDGRLALAAIETSAPAIVILDLIMPKIGGFELLTRLNRAGTPRPKVIVLSARGREDDVTRAFSRMPTMLRPATPQMIPMIRTRSAPGPIATNAVPLITALTDEMQAVRM